MQEPRSINPRWRDQQRACQSSATSAAFSSPPSDGGEDQGEGAAHVNTSRARSLRKRATDEERILWSQLRNRKLTGYKFRRQHEVGPYTLDFFCPSSKLSVELDGRQHGHPELKQSDAERTAYLAEVGISEIRFWNYQVRKELRSVIATILRELQTRTPHLDPLPLPTRGEENALRKPVLQFVGPRNSETPSR